MNCSITDRYSHDLYNIINTLHHKCNIECMVEQIYNIRKDYISKWFSTIETIKEVLESEHINNFINGGIYQSESAYYDPISYQIVRKFKNGYVYLEKYSDGIFGKNRDYECESINDYFNILNPDKKIIELNNSDSTKTRFLYNEYGKVIKVQKVNGNGNTETLVNYLYKFDQNGLVIEQTIIWPDEKRIISYMYDDNGNEIFTEWNDKNGVKKQGKSQYNEYNDIVFEDNWWNGKRIKKRYEYKYDKYNNWIERRIFEDEKYVKLNIRQFKYEEII